MMKNLILIIFILIITGCYTAKERVMPLGPHDDNYGKIWVSN